MSNDKKVAISVKGITKSFRIPLDKGVGVKAKILGRATRGYREFTPLNDITFDVYEGDFFGIVGRNGSGKSTLLKTIAGIYEPTAGRVKVEGTLVPFIELGVGFNPNLTGRENVYLNAALLGFSREETDGMYDDIVDFAELHDFMEERLQNYSSGMQVRLAFSIAIRAKGDILLLDEVLAVGDSAFQQKCFDYFDQLKDEKKTVILVTHSMSNVERFCNRGLLLNAGKIDTIGSSEEVADRYRELFKQEAVSGPSTGGGRSNSIIECISCEIAPSLGSEANSIKFKENFSLTFDFLRKDESYVNFNFTFEIRNSRDLLVLSSSFTALNAGYLNFTKKNLKVTFDIDNILTDGNYYINAKAIAESPAGHRVDVYSGEKIEHFSVIGAEHNKHSLVHPTINTSVDDSAQVVDAD